MSKVSLTGIKVLTARDLEGIKAAAEVAVSAGTILTPSARDVIQAKQIRICQENGVPCAAASVPSASPAAGSATNASEAKRVFNSPEAQIIKKEMIRNARKLWDRQYVDGNGGNLSYRIAPGMVICTPTLLSKADVSEDDLCMVDLEGNQIEGTQKRTSEIFLHLEMYKAVPEAKAVIHAHPPHATAYALVGKVPPTCVIPEHEVFVGQVAYTEYETPGTQKFAETVLPFVKTHNTILLGNHGVVCWADTLTHAEWYQEIVDTYCRTLMLAAQLGSPITRIPADKAKALLTVKKRLGLPDARFELQECQLCDAPDPGGITACPGSCGCSGSDKANPEVETLVKMVTDEVMKALKLA